MLIVSPEMRSARDIHPVTAYSVDISPSAWSQLATLASDDYARIRAKLDAIAAELGAARSQDSSRDSGSADARAFIAGGYAVLYAVDAERTRVTLLEVTRRIPEEE
jgi:mRNA-degrading endonuclease RelE of RelBE toxin-antitoxin system